MVMNSLKIPQKKSESINRRRTDNAIGQTKKDKQRSTKHYTENYGSSNANITKTWG